MSGNFSWVIGTNATKVQWYQITNGTGGEILVTLHDVLDLSQVTVFADKESAKRSAIEAGLKTWRYARL